MSNDIFPNIIRISPVHKPAGGTLSVPGSKSIGNRALLLAAAAHGESRLKGILDSDDTRAALQVLSSLGVPHQKNNTDISVSGTGLSFPSRHGEIDIHSSGTVGRFLPGLLAACNEGEWKIVSTQQLATRPLGPLVKALTAWGANLEHPTPGASFPLVIRASGLDGGHVSVSAAASSQFASGLLMAAPLCRRPATVEIADLDPEEAYIDMTLDLLRRFGVEPEAEHRDDVLTVSFASPLRYQAADMTIEADANTANYFLSLAVLTGGSVTVDNLRPSSRQPGLKFLNVLERLGGTVIRGDTFVTASGNPLPLRGGFTIDMRAMSEMALTLGVMSAFADKPIAMTNLSHIRGHESDRITALASLLGQVGVRTGEVGDGITIHPPEAGKIKPAVIDPHDDHRIAMSFALLGAAANGIAITSPGCVDKTCPPFFSLLEKVGVTCSG